MKNNKIKMGSEDFKRLVENLSKDNFPPSEDDIVDSWSKLLSKWVDLIPENDKKITLREYINENKGSCIEVRWVDHDDTWFAHEIGFTDEGLDSEVISIFYKNGIDYLLLRG